MAKGDSFDLDDAWSVVTLVILGLSSLAIACVVAVALFSIAWILIR